MPYGDGTGPRGMGPMTGRRGGFCTGYGVPGFLNFIRGWGRGRGMGAGRGSYRGMGRMRGRSFGVTTGPGR
jgi:hypothetical protein